MKVAVGDGAVKKSKLSESQADMLEWYFGTEQKLEAERKDRLATELGLEPRQVAVWFQNRRARWRSKRMEEEVARLWSQNETASLENCRLENEILKLKEQLKEAEREIKKLSSSIPCLSMDANEVSPSLEGFEGFEDVSYLEQVYN